MAGYTRQDTANNIANGNVIDADDFDAEYNAIESAFNASTGHTHDGTSAEGAPITKVGPSQDVVVSATNVNPKTTNTLDLGTSSLQYKNAHFDGIVYQDTASVGANDYMTLTDNEIDISNGNLTVDVAGDIILDADGADILLKDAGTQFASLTNNSGNLIIKSGTTTAATFTGANVSLAGTLGVTGAATLSSTAAITGNATVGGTLGVTGESTLASATVSDLTSGRVVLAGTSGAIEDSGNLTFNGSTLGVTGAATISTNLTVNGNTTLGNADTDTVTVTADVASDLIPSADSTYSLGDSSNYWSHGYIDAVTTTGNVTVGGNLNVTGNTVVTGNTTNAAFLYELGTGTTGVPSNDAGIIVERGSSDNAFIGFDESVDKFIVGTGAFTSASTGNLTITTGTLLANIEGNVTGNVTGDVKATNGTSVLDSGTNGTDATFTGNVTGDLTGNADTATNAGTATALQTARTIGGVSFDGTANINLPGVNTAGTQDTSGNAATATTAGTVTTAAQPNITSVGTLTTLTVDDITINGSTISDADALLFDIGTDLTIDVDGGDIFLKDGGTQRGSIDVATASTVKHTVWDGVSAYSEEMRLTTSGVNVINGLRVGDDTAPTDNDIYAAADIEAANNLTAGNEIVMSGGASDWTFEVDGSNNLIIQYGGTSLMKLDSSGNLTVTGNITAYGTI